MGRRWGRSDARQDAAWAGARAADSRWAAQDRFRQALTAAALPPCEEDAGAVGFDATCRFARDGGLELGLHACTTSFGQLVQPGQTCWMEAHQLLREQAAVLRAAGEAVRP